MSFKERYEKNTVDNAFNRRLDRLHHLLLEAWKE